MQEIPNIIAAIARTMQAQKERIELLEWQIENYKEENERLKKELEK